MLPITRQRFKSYSPIIPWLILATIFGMTWAGMHFVILAPAEEHLARVEAERITVRQKASRRQEAKETARDLAKLLALLPTQRDFSQLPLTISEDASHNGVTLSSLSYTVEKADQGPARKAMFQGPVTGRYEDLRRFIYSLESGGRLVFIEDLDVSRPISSERGSPNRDALTFKLHISTYIRKSAASPGSGQGVVTAPASISDVPARQEAKIQ
jgi:Tfp pilus assembly protein PilO